MNAIEKPKMNSFFGYNRQKRAMECIFQDSLEEAHVIMQHGPSGTGKSQATQYWKSIAPPGRYFFISCNTETNEGTFKYTISNLQRMFQNSLSFFHIFFDEADVVCVQRKSETIEILPLVQRMMALINTIKQRRRSVIILCTNCPTLIDSAISTRCDDVIYLPLPAQYEIQDAFISLGYSQDQANEVANEWVAEMQVHGFWSGRQLFPVIMKYGSEVSHLGTLEAVRHLDGLVRGPRIADPLGYEIENGIWVNAANRTLDRWDPLEMASSVKRDN